MGINNNFEAYWDDEEGKAIININLKELSPTEQLDFISDLLCELDFLSDSAFDDFLNYTKELNKKYEKTQEKRMLIYDKSTKQIKETKGMK